MIIAVDFDGTCVLHEYPMVGPDCPGAVEVLKKLVENNHQLILWTIRSNQKLDEAVNWFSKHGISLYGVNLNPQQKKWSQSPKVFAKLYIDDAALGCPIIHVPPGRPFVDWEKVRLQLDEEGLL